ncbi:MAG TPA: ABC transporter substrate-binding protein [Pyrinomonadaceae bacterium]|nr:ABC transporter substrate-binding protein [Pyrinomonadaceae bacterium]
MKRTLLPLGLIFTLLAISACQRGGSGNVERKADDTGNIKVGVYADLSGQTNDLGQSTKNGVELAKDEINQAGGIGGRQIELIVEDDKGLPDQAATAVAKLINQDQVHAVVGGAAAPSSLMAAPKAQEAKVPMITLAAADPKVTQTGDYIFRVAFLDSVQGEVMAKYAANNIKAKTAAILFEENSDYSRELAQSFEKTFVQLGGQVTEKQSYAQSDQDFNRQLSPIQAANPDVVYIPGRSKQIGAIAKQARGLGLKAVLLGADGWNDPQLLQLGGEALDGAYITGHYSADDPTQAVRDFTSAYKKRYGKPPDPTAALAYDAMRILADSLKRAGTSDGLKLRDAIAQTSKFSGVAGTITLNAERNASKPALIFKLQGGKIFPVYREET